MTLTAVVHSAGLGFLSHVKFGSVVWSLSFDLPQCIYATVQ